MLQGLLLGIPKFISMYHNDPSKISIYDEIFNLISLVHVIIMAFAIHDITQSHTPVRQVFQIGQAFK